MKAIKQYFDIECFNKEQAREKNTTSFILNAIQNKKEYNFNRIKDDDEKMISIYRKKDEEKFLMVIATNIGKGIKGINTNYYYITPKEKLNDEFYIMAGSLVRELCRENDIKNDLKLSDFKDVFVC